MMEEYFPLHIATGKAFCNRSEEQNHLFENINRNRPTLIMSTRRYGKTSLVSQVVNKNNCFFAKADFMSAIDIDDVERIITTAVGSLLVSLENGVKKALTLATNFFSDLNFNISLDRSGIKFEASRKSVKPHRRIRGLLDRLRNLSKQYDKPLVLYFDEFQHLSEIIADDSMEAVIREIAQEPANISFIFSGSNRHLIQKMFDDKNRPFYKLCDKINLKRISKADYHKHIAKIANVTKIKNITTNVIDTILECTECHPYYVNLLCDRVWRQKDINENIVLSTWDKYALEERSHVAIEIENLSQHQKKLLIVLARTGGTNSPRSDEFIAKCNMAGSTISQALNVLIRKDYVEENMGHYTVLDPLIGYVLQR
ncbi:MAG: ATP-binding protein [Legionellales bacterium]|nr:ATP-binding protein [Legionellales bacterium]